MMLRFYMLHFPICSKWRKHKRKINYGIMYWNRPTFHLEETWNWYRDDFINPCGKLIVFSYAENCLESDCWSCAWQFKSNMRCWWNVSERHLPFVHWSSVGFIRQASIYGTVKVFSSGKIYVTEGPRSTFSATYLFLLPQGVYECFYMCPSRSISRYLSSTLLPLQKVSLSFALNRTCAVLRPVADPCKASLVIYTWPLAKKFCCISIPG